MKVLLLPGASLMEITALDDGIRVRCPGCGHEEVYRGAGPRAFAHAEPCPVHRRIEQAAALAGGDGEPRG